MKANLSTVAVILFGTISYCTEKMNKSTEDFGCRDIPNIPNAEG